MTSPETCWRPFSLRVVTLPCLATLVFSACVPILAHPTRVNPGFEVGTYYTFGIAADSGAQGESSVLPSIDLELAVGIRDPSRDTGPSLRVSASGGFSGSGVGAYTEFPREWLGDLDAGAGFAIHYGASTSMMPYLQVGRRLGEDYSWFVRNTAAFIRADSGTRSALWIPTIGLSRHTTGRAGNVDVFASAIIGPQQPFSTCLFWCEPSSSRMRAMAGVALRLVLDSPRGAPFPRRP